MRAFRVTAFATVALLGSLIGGRGVEAQEPSADKERGCLGHEMHIRFEMPFGTLTDFPVIGAVPPGTPAALAGLQPGDSVLTIEGRDSRDKPPRPLRAFAPGDPFSMTVRRQQTDIPLVLVFGRTLQQGAGTDVPRVCRPIRSASKP
jgi:membrane-associated protease RseP (regulator of RpoE activity)